MHDTIHADVFNGAMKSIYRELEEIKALLVKREDERKDDIRLQAAMEARINHLLEKQNRLDKMGMTLFGGVGVLFIWKLIEVLGRR